MKSPVAEAPMPTVAEVVSGFNVIAPVVEILSAVVPKSIVSAISVIAPEPAEIVWSLVSRVAVPLSKVTAPLAAEVLSVPFRVVLPP